MVDAAGDQLMTIYAEPVVRHGASRAPGALPSAALLTVDIDGERTAAARLRRGGHIATAGMAAAVIAVLVSAFAPLPNGRAGSTYDSSALAHTFPEPFPTQEAQPLAAERGRVSIDLGKADDPAAGQGEAPNLFGIPLPSLPTFLQDDVQATAPAVGGPGASGPGEQAGAAGPSSPSDPASPIPPATGDPSTSPSPSGGGPGTTTGGTGSPTSPAGGDGAPAGPTDPPSDRPSPSDPTPTAPATPGRPTTPTQPPPSAPGGPTQPGPTQPGPTQPAPTQPEPTQPEPEPTEPEPTVPPVVPPRPVSPPPATEPPGTPPPAATAPLTVDASCRVTGRGLLGLVTSNECTVRLAGEPNAQVDVFHGGRRWTDVRLDAFGKAAPVARSADLLGVVGLLDDLLIGSEFTASYR